MANETNYTPHRYRGNGITKNFAFSYKLFDNEDIIVQTENILTGQQQSLQLGTDYSVDRESVGGQIECVNAPSSEYDIILSRSTPDTQGVKYSTSTGFQGSEIEKSFDKVSANLQELDYTLQRAIKSPVGSASLDLTLPQPDAGKAVVWGGDLKGLVNSKLRVDEVNGLVTQAETYANQASSSATQSGTSASSASTSEASSLIHKNEAETARNLSIQYAVGLPSEPAEGSAKYWALQSAQSQVQVDYAQTDTNATDFIKNKPTNFSRIQNISISTSWLGSVAPFSQEVVISNLLTNDLVKMALVQSNDFEVADLEMAEYSKIFRGVVSDGKITFYADDKTDRALTVQIEINK